jgi:hypothetical protein
MRHAVLLHNDDIILVAMTVLPLAAVISFPRHAIPNLALWKQDLYRSDPQDGSDQNSPELRRGVDPIRWTVYVSRLFVFLLPKKER